MGREKKQASACHRSVLLGIGGISSTPWSKIAHVVVEFPPLSGTSGIPHQQLAPSMVLLVDSVLGGLWIAAKLLRIYLLMYGKRPRLREIVRALRAS